MNQDDKIRILKAVGSISDIMNYYAVDFVIRNNKIELYDLKNDMIITQERMKDISASVLRGDNDKSVDDSKQ